MLHIEKSLHPLTEFTPTWNFYFWTAVYDSENLEKVKSWIIDNEKRLIDVYSSNSRSDGGTGLGKESLTAQYNSFNLFKETEHLPEFNDLKKFIKSEYDKFMIESRSLIRKCNMYCWANVLKTGETIKKHNHGAWHYSYLSGNMHLGDYSTTTRYHNPFNESYLDFQNVKGGLTFFPSYLYHETTEYNDKDKRVSIAFDLLDNISIDQGYDKNRIDF